MMAQNTTLPNILEFCSIILIPGHDWRDGPEHNKSSNLSYQYQDMIGMMAHNTTLHNILEFCSIIPIPGYDLHDGPQHNTA